MAHDHEHDHENCNHDHDQDEWIVLVDEEGVEHRYALERVVELGEKKYVIMVPEIQESDEDEAHVFRIDTDEEGEEILVDVDDEEIEQIQEALENEDWDGEDEEDEEAGDNEEK
jgi:uncharacterized protein YrzB (UPF0473 family)